MGLASRLRALGKAAHPGPVAVVSAVAGLLALSAGRGLRGTLIVTAAVMAGQLSVGWSNDYMDADLDRAHQRADKPIVAGRIPKLVVGVAALLALILCVPLSLAAGTQAAGAHFAALGAAFMYNAGFKRTPLSVLTYATAFGLLPAFVTLGPPLHHFPAVWATLAASLAGAGAHFTQTLPDIERERAAGQFGLPQLVGERLSALMGAVLLTAAALVVALGASSLPTAAAFVLTLVLAAAGMVTTLLGRKHLAFQLTLGAAAAMAAGVVLAGARF